MAFEISPHPFDGIEFGAVRRQMQQCDVVGNLQRLGDVPTGLIQDQHDVFIFTGLFADEPQVFVHVIGVDGWSDQRRRSTRDGVHRCEEVHPFVFRLLDGGGA